MNVTDKGNLVETIIFRECINLNKKLYFWESSTITPMLIDLEQEKSSILEISNREELRGEPVD